MGRDKHRQAAAAESRPATVSQDQPGKTYYDMVRSISKDPDLLRAVDEAEKAEAAKEH